MCIYKFFLSIGINPLIKKHDGPDPFMTERAHIGTRYYTGIYLTLPILLYRVPRTSAVAVASDRVRRDSLRVVVVVVVVVQSSPSPSSTLQTRSHYNREGRRVRVHIYIIRVHGGGETFFMLVSDRHTTGIIYI